MASRSVRLAQLLGKKTKDGELQWKRTERDEVFQHAFPDYSVRIHHEHEPLFDQDDYVLTIYNQEGLIIERFTNGDLQREGLPEAYNSMQEMYNTARRSAMGIDKALDDLLTYLDDDIPF